jgi:hypothetical protein
VAASEFRRLEERVRELELMLGRKIMEVEILKEALDLARAKKPTLLSRSLAPGDTPVKTVAATLGVARSNIIECQFASNCDPPFRVQSRPLTLRTVARDTDSIRTISLIGRC